MIQVGKRTAVSEAGNGPTGKVLYDQSLWITGPFIAENLFINQLGGSSPWHSFPFLITGASFHFRSEPWQETPMSVTKKQSENEKPHSTNPSEQRCSAPDLLRHGFASFFCSCSRPDALAGATFLALVKEKSRKLP